MTTSRTHGEGAAQGALTFIEKKEIAVAATSVTFSNLDGNADGMYVLEAYVLTALAGNTHLYLNPNGLTTNQITSRFDLGAAYARQNPYGRMSIGFLSAANQVINSTAKIWARATGPGSTALDRVWTADMTWRAASDVQCYLFKGVWEDSSTNITSIEIEASQASGIGVGSTFALYKLDI